MSPTRCFKVVLFSFCLLLCAPVTKSLADSEQVQVVISGTPVNLALPSGHCGMSRTLASDERLIEMIEKGSNNTIEVILAFADCKQLEAWRVGSRKVLDDFGQYQTLVSAKGRNFKGSEALLIKQVCDQQRKSGQAIFDQATTTVNKYLDTTVKALKVSEFKLIGILSESTQNCSMTFLQKLTTEFGDEKTQFGINTTTILNGKVVYLNIYTRYDGEASVGKIRQKHETALKALIAAN